MSGMANEIANRMAAEGNTPVDTTGAVPGNAGDVPPAAEPSTTDTGTQGGTPETIPYPRFKEVNDRYTALKPYEELAGYGYDADSLRRLAVFEQQYNSDPIGTLRNLAVNLDLPEDVLSAIDAHVAVQGATPPAQGEPTGDAPQTPALSEADRRRLDAVDSILAERDQTTREAKLDSVVAAWDALDKEAGIETSVRTKLTWISAAAGGGQKYDTVEELAKAAHTARMEERDRDLGAAVQRPGQGLAPPALPGSAPVPVPPVKFANLQEASAAALADINAGRL